MPGHDRTPLLQTALFERRTETSKKKDCKNGKERCSRDKGRRRGVVVFDLFLSKRNSPNLKHTQKSAQSHFSKRLAKWKPLKKCHWERQFPKEGGGEYALGGRPKYAQNMRKYALKYALNVRNPKKMGSGRVPHISSPRHFYCKI